MNFLFLIVFAVAPHAEAQQEKPHQWRVDSSVAFTLNQEQTRGSSGQSGGKLFQDLQAAALLSGTRSLTFCFDAGLFFLFEQGLRSAAQFNGVDASGTPGTRDKLSGTQTTYWFGPIIRGNYRWAFLEAAYIAFGRRSDTAYPTLASTGGSRDAFRTHPLKSWLFSAGFGVPMNEALDLVVRVEYRYLYYNRRGSEKLPNDIVYGNQSIRPHIGVAWRF